jgi:hypothetical protein
MWSYTSTPYSFIACAYKHFSYHFRAERQEALLSLQTLEFSGVQCHIIDDK